MMTKKKADTTYDLAVLLEKCSQLLKSLPETKLHDLKKLTEIVEAINENNNGKISSIQSKKEQIDSSTTHPIGDTNWKDDYELKNMSKAELNKYLSDKNIFSVKEKLYSYANYLNITGISRRTSKAGIIDIITKHYERN